MRFIIQKILLATFFLFVFSTSKATTIDDLVKQITALQQQISQLQAQLATIQQTSFTFAKDLKQTDQNDDVFYLQRALRADGVYCKKCYVTGYFGTGTRNSLIAFQKKYGLSVTGIADNATRLKLNQVLPQTLAVVPTPTSTPTSAPSPIIQSPAFPVSIAILGGDLDVLYIERTPKYQKYRVTYFLDRGACAPENPNYYPYTEDRGPQLCPGESAKKRWPSPGESVTFTAYIKNNDTIATGAFGYKWFVDGQEVKSGIHASIDVGQVSTETFSWNWPLTLDDHKIKFVADPLNLVIEKFENNNQVEDYTNALYFSIAVNNATYNALKSSVGSSSPSSPEDWIKSQIAKMNYLFLRDGVLEHVRIDKIVLSDSDFSILEKYNADGTWFILGDYRKSGYYDPSEDVDYGLLHELIHQLGVIDLYNMNSDTQYDKLLDKKYNRVGAGCGTEYGWLASWDCYVLVTAQPLMGNDLANMVAHQIGSHTGTALNKNLHKRRGYFGEYLFDVPAAIKVKFQKSNGQILDGAAVNIYQPGLDRVIDSTRLQQTLTTDANGIITLNPISGSWINTAQTETGHQLKANPYGLISVVGPNGLFLFEIEKNGQYDYKWLPLALANMEYWKGSTQEVSFTIATTLP